MCKVSSSIWLLRCFYCCLCCGGVHTCQTEFRTCTRSKICSLQNAGFSSEDTADNSLMSALLLARLLTSVAASLACRYKLLPPRCYTDSLVSLHWIKGVNKNWKTFIQNRVKEIRDLVPVEHWNHCPGSETPLTFRPEDLAPQSLSAVTCGEMDQNG